MGDQHVRSGPRRLLDKLGSAALTVFAVLGVGCIVLLILSWTMGFSLVMFSTGSMAPTIPAGSVALVREVDAARLEVGDVVTVDRPGKLPITHRVIEIQSVQATSATFVMRGDANADPDPSPYTAEKVRLVLGSIPRVAPAIAALQKPQALGAATLAATALVTWAFWPRRGEDDGLDSDDAENDGTDD